MICRTIKTNELIPQSYLHDSGEEGGGEESNDMAMTPEIEYTHQVSSFCVAKRLLIVISLTLSGQVFFGCFQRGARGKCPRPVTPKRPD